MRRRYKSPLARRMKRRNDNARRTTGGNCGGLHCWQFSDSVAVAGRNIEKAVELGKRARGSGNDAGVTAR